MLGKPIAGEEAGGAGVKFSPEDGPLGASAQEEEVSLREGALKEAVALEERVSLGEGVALKEENALKEAVALLEGALKDGVGLGEENALGEEVAWKEENALEEGVALEDTQCGFGSCKPSWIQPCANIKMFTLTLAMIHTFGSMNYSYYSAVITQIEKSFGLSSAVTGFLKNVDNIGHILVSLVIGHFFRYTHKPRLFAIATLLTGVAVFLFGLPHLIYGSQSAYDTYDSSSTSDTSGSTNDSVSAYTSSPTDKTPRSNATFGELEMCDGISELDEKGCSTRTSLKPLNVGALAIFILSELLQGIAQTPKSTLAITYMDDNAKKKSPIYFGFLFATRACAPLLGFMLGAWCTSLYVDLSAPELSPKDPRWVGAWWLGFVICGACTLVWTLPLALFPPVIPGEVTANTGYKKPKHRSAKEDLKDLPRALWRLLTNPIILCNLLAAGFSVSIIGYVTFFPKYLEMHFGMTAAKASSTTGLISICSFTIGPIISGTILTKMEVSVSRAQALLAAMKGVYCLGFVLMLFLGCPQGEWAGGTKAGRVDASLGCNSNCSCDPFLFAPVCGSDHVNYFSSCYAGCTGMTENATGKVLTGCACIPDGQATVGQCSYGCSMMYPYLAVVLMTKLAASMTSVPIVVINTRSVAEKDKALSLALFGFVIMIMSFPAPMLYGFVIDGACLVQQESCVRKGACLLYDSDKFRYMLHGIGASFKFGAFVCSVLGYVFGRRMEKREKEVKKKEEEREMMSKEEERKEMLPVKT